MSRGAASIIVLLSILLLTAFFFVSPSILAQQNSQDSETVKELMVKRFTSLGNSVAHAAFVEDAVIMGEEANLTEIITRLQKDEPELTFIHFTDAKNEVLASNDSTMIGKVISSNVLTTGSSAVREGNGIYECGFSIDIAKKRVGVLYFGAKPGTSAAAFSSYASPIVIVVGVVFAIVAFAATLMSRRSIRAKVIDEMNRRQEEVFSPKIEALKQAQTEAQSRLNEVNANIKNAESELERFSDEYEVRKKEAESDPLVQSVEKLKAAEVKLIKHIEELKEGEAQLNTEISLLSQKREEVLNALDAEKKEERTLHEKLDLIKKKILHLETPGK
jgi:DNA repair exonuclease SbcCD ATPase subunit